MDARYRYPSEKFYNAVRSLLGGEPLRNRLHSAWIYNLHIIESDRVPREEPNDDLRDRVATLHGKLTQDGARKMTDDEAEETAREIFDIYVELERRYQRGD